MARLNLQRPYSAISGTDCPAAFYQDGTYFDAEGNKVDIKPHLEKYHDDGKKTAAVTIVDTIKPLEHDEAGLLAMDRDALVVLHYNRTSSMPAQGGRATKKDIAAALIEHDKARNPEHYAEIEAAAAAAAAEGGEGGEGGDTVTEETQTTE